MNLSEMTPAQREEHRKLVQALYDKYYSKEKDKARDAENLPRKPSRKRAAK